MEFIKKLLKEKPLNKVNLVHYYTPMLGSGTFCGLGINVITPGMLRSLPPRGADLTNVFLASSITGTFLYLYNRRHLKKVPSGDKWKFCLLTSTMFNLGSLLLWAIIRSGTSDVNAPQFKVFIALTTAYGFITLGIKYLDAIDEQIK